MDKGCMYCSNSFTNPDLDENFDASSFGLGQSSYDGHTFGIMFSSETPSICPVSLEFQYWDKKIERWMTVGLFVPHYCPFCGRKIEENEGYFEREKNKARKKISRRS